MWLMTVLPVLQNFQDSCNSYPLRRRRPDRVASFHAPNLVDSPLGYGTRPSGPQFRLGIDFALTN